MFFNLHKVTRAKINVLGEGGLPANNLVKDGAHCPRTL
ncbi:MAG: hypothetical protein RL147_804 [Actinomycetota bacterium]|jgi:hypothetical protein